MRAALIVILLATTLVQAATNAPPTRSPITYAECGSKQRSLRSATSLHLVFANHTRGKVSIYWLDFTGERVWYNTLEPGYAYSQQTYVTHPWEILDANGRCIAHLVATAAGTFEIPIRD